MEFFNFFEDIRIDIFWGEVIVMKNRIINILRFLLMVKIVRVVMIIFNFNVECERIFFMMKKIYIDIRLNLDNFIFCVLLIVKVNNI